MIEPHLPASKTECMVNSKLLFMLILGITALLCQQSSAADDQTVDAIIRQNVDAMGGLYNWSQVESIQLNSTVERDGQTIKLCVIKKRPNLIRATITIPTPGKQDAYHQIIQAHDGKEAWTAKRRAGDSSLNKKTMSPQAAEGLLAEAGVYPPLMKLWQANQKLQLTGTNTINNERVFVIETPSTSATRHCFYVSTESYRTVAIQSTSADGTTLTHLSGYQKTDNVYLPTRVHVKASQTGESTIKTDSIQIGVGIYNEYFQNDTNLHTAVSGN